MTVVPEVASRENPANHSELSDCQTIKGNWILVITNHSKKSKKLGDLYPVLNTSVSKQLIDLAIT